MYTPCISDLFKKFEYLSIVTAEGEKTKPLSPERKEELRDFSEAADNSLAIIHNGMRGIGQMMSRIGLETYRDKKTEGLDSQTLVDVGGLIEELSKAADILTFHQSEISSIRSRSDILS